MDPQFVSHPPRESQVPGKFASLWIDTTPKTNYPSLEEGLTLDVVVIGGGIVGITTALFLKEAGLKVALLEAGRIIESTTGFTTAKITSAHGLIYDSLISSLGREKAQLHAQAGETAIERIESIVEKYKIDCDFFRTPAYTFGEEKTDIEEIKKEAEAAKSLGLPASYEEKIPLPLKIYGAVKFGAQAQFHPRKYLLNLAAKLPGKGSFIFENTKAVSFKEGEPCTVITDKGEIRAKDIVVATHVPFFKEPGFFFSRLYQIHSYVLGVYINGQIPQGMFYGTQSHTIRTQPAKKGTILIVGGEDHKTGQGEDIIQRYQKLVDYYQKIYPLKQIAYHWSTQDPDTPDGLPFIGRVAPGSSHVYIASGFHGWGMTNGTVSAMLISDLILGRENPWTEIYNPTRLNLKGSAGRFLKETVNVGKEFITSKLPKKEEINLSKLQTGEGKVGNLKGRTVGVYKNDQGRLFVVAEKCTFEGCDLVWNNAEKTWDCPCCGSRFTYDGHVLYGPAINNL